KGIGVGREMVPHLRQMAVLANAGYPAAMLEMEEVQAAARILGLEVAAFEVRRSTEIASAFEALKGRAEARFLVGDPLMTSNRIRINTLAPPPRLPTISLTPYLFHTP